MVWFLKELGSIQWQRGVLAWVRKQHVRMALLQESCHVLQNLVTRSCRKMYQTDRDLGTS
jgi:hypothetical protein